MPIIAAEILQQREYLTRHLRPKSRPKQRMAASLPYKASRPRRCRFADKAAGIRNCRASIPCPPGRCCRGYLEALTESRLREYSQVLGPDGAGNFWELGALASVGERPDPGRLDDRNDMVRELRSRRNAAGTEQESAPSGNSIL